MKRIRLSVELIVPEEVAAEPDSSALWLTEIVTRSIMAKTGLAPDQFEVGVPPAKIDAFPIINLEGRP